MKQMTRIAFCFILILSTVSCVSTTAIKALNKKGEIDKDVKVYVDNKYIGNGEADYSDSKSIFSPIPFVELKKEGCQNYKEKLDTHINWIQYLSGITISLVGLTQKRLISKILYVNPLFLSLPISITGIMISTWGRKYAPVQQQEFQCVKITE